MRYWNPDWTLERAGFGGAGGGMAGIRGITCLEDDILATYPRDEVRACPPAGISDTSELVVRTTSPATLRRTKSMRARSSAASPAAKLPPASKTAVSRPSRRIARAARARQGD